MMLRERYTAINLFEFVPALAATVDPVLTQLDDLLDDDRLFQLVKADLLERFPQTSWNGRPSTPVEVILRMLVVKHLYAFSYAQTEHWVSDSLVLRQFCRVYLERVPDDTTLIRWANLIKPENFRDINFIVFDLTATCLYLWEGYGIITAIALKAGVARGFPGLTPPEKSFVGQNLP